MRKNLQRFTGPLLDMYHSLSRQGSYHPVLSRKETVTTGCITAEQVAEGRLLVILCEAAAAFKPVVAHLTGGCFKCLSREHMSRYCPKVCAGTPDNLRALLEPSNAQKRKAQRAEQEALREE